MSALETAPAPAGPQDRAGASRRTRLSLVDPPEARMRRTPFLLVLAFVLGAGLVGLLVLNTSLQAQAFEARTLNRQASLLANQQAQLQTRVDGLRSPQTLADKAATLGMRPNDHPGFIKLPDGTIIGKPEKVTDTGLPPWLRSTAEDTAREKATLAATKKAAQEQADAAKAEAAAAKAKADQAKADQAKADKAKADQAKADAAKAKQQTRTGGN